MDTPTPGRAPRCLRLVEHTNGIKVGGTNQCPNERLPGADECAKHLAQAVADFHRITEQVRRIGEGTPDTRETLARAS